MSKVFVMKQTDKWVLTDLTDELIDLLDERLKSSDNIVENHALLLYRDRAQRLHDIISETNAEEVSKKITIEDFKKWNTNNGKSEDSRDKALNVIFQNFINDYYGDNTDCCGGESCGCAD